MKQAPKPTKNILPRLLQYEDTKYYASSTGDVFRENNGTYRKMCKIKTKKQRYCSVKICHKGNIDTTNVHVIVARCFIGIRPNGYQINHIDGNRLNNNVLNLEYCTASENINHAFKLGLIKPAKGEKNGMAKISPQDVFAVRELYASGKRVSEIAIEYKGKMCRQNIGLIVNNKTWTHLLHRRKRKLKFN